MSAPDERGNTSIYSRENILSLYLPAIILGLGTGVAAPAIPVYAKSFDVSFGTASLVFIVYLAGGMLAAIPTGFLIDRIGRRKVLLAGPILLGISSILVATAQSFELLLLWRLVGGAAQQMWQIARLAMIADTGGDRQRGRQITGMVAMTSAGNLLGPAVGGFLATVWDVRVPFIVHGCLAILAIVPSFLMVRETAPELRSGAAQPRGEASRSRQGWLSWGVLWGLPFLAAFLMVQTDESGKTRLRLWPFFVLAFFLAQFLGSVTRGTLFSGTVNLYPVYAYNAGPDVVGLLNALGAAVGLPITFAAGALMDRFGRKVTIVPGFVILGLGLAFTSLTAFMAMPFPAFVVAFVWFQLGVSITSGNMQVIGSDIAPSHAKGQFFSAWRFVGEIGQLASPAAFAFLAEAYAYGAAFGFLTITAFGTALVLGLLVRETLGSGPTSTSAPEPRPAPAAA
jgi:MFS family permease